MTELGQYFKKERERQGLDLKDLARRSKIPLPTLTAIEDGDQANLPAKPFLRGFVRSYAKLLGLDVEASIELFEKEYGSSGAPLKPKAVSKPVEEVVVEEPTDAVSIFQAPRSFFIFFGFSVTIVLCIFIYLAIQKMALYEEEKQNAVSLEESAIVGNVASDAIDEPSETETANPLQTDAKVEAAPENQKSAEPEKVVQETKPAPAKKDEPVAALKKIAEKQEKKVEKMEADEEVSAKATPPKPAKVDSASGPSSHKLSIEAFEPVRLEIVWSVGSPQIFLLKANEIKNIVFTKPVKVLLSDGGVINITFDGENIGVPGQIRKPIELKYP